MLTKFKVSNFKSFNKDFTLDLTETNGYTFNSECIKNGIVNNALVYGHNGVGKSNLALAIFDIIENLTDRNKNDTEYSAYLNAYNSSDTADFHYEFLINSNKVVYEYKKTDHKTIVYEKFLINDEELAFLDRRMNNNAVIKFKGAETLKTEINNNNLALLKYIKNNSELDQDHNNSVFNDFFKFIEGLLFFRSLQTNYYLGIELGPKKVAEDIIEKNNVADLERFLNEAGVECKLTVIDLDDKKTLAFDFNGKTIPFYNIASQGTRALVLFYFWFQRIKEKSKVSFLFIDEFDAFYHHELSALIVKELKQTGVQFILTTHNTSIITNDLLRPDCYFLMNKNVIRSLSKSTPKELREAHNIEKMYKAGTFYVE
ncbi:ATP/GTP-binding protein [Flavobacterium sp.]|jgi:AAA15 family ATPase/GTPase|uniref:AAA family ATPase n=1 Tax=Flavobacterium sp. TaxID=239 RepID=UPI0022C5902A|nr:ATP-binding protein [Flavobacterium sp.]MCZ8366884.1 ATP-binding protein [Flavobacterium sp.]